MYSAKQLAFKVFTLMQSPDIKTRIQAQLEQPNPRFRAESPDEAVERVFEFDRNWALFELPRLLTAPSRIQRTVFLPRFGFAGDYRYFASRVEALFRVPVVGALEEYGLPVQLADKLQAYVRRNDDIDESLNAVRSLNVKDLPLTPFESKLLSDVQAEM